MKKPGRWSVWLLSLATFIISVTVVLVAAEIIVRLCVPKETFWLVSNIYKPSKVPNLFYTYKPEFKGIAFGVSLETNSIGFRGPEWYKFKEPKTFRIALIGDSHAFGFGVPFERTVGEVLSTILEKKYVWPVEVLNFGVNGYTSFQQKAVLEHFALGYRPDMVILLPTGNDHQSALHADNEGWLHWDGNEGNNKSRVIDKSLPKPSWLLGKSRLLLYLKLVQKRLDFHEKTQVQKDQSASSQFFADRMRALPPQTVSERLETAVYKPLNDMLIILKKNSIPVIISSINVELDYRQMFQIFQKEYNVPSLEFLPLFPEVDSWESLVAKFSLGWDNHLNAIAHERQAKALVNLIEEYKFFPK